MPFLCAFFGQKTRVSTGAMWRLRISPISGHDFTLKPVQHFTPGRSNATWCTALRRRRVGVVGFENLATLRTKVTLYQSRAALWLKRHRGTRRIVSVIGSRSSERRDLHNHQYGTDEHKGSDEVHPRACRVSKILQPAYDVRAHEPR